MDKNKDHNHLIDIVDHLSYDQLRELEELTNEPDEKDTVTMDEFIAATDKWRASKRR